MKDVKVALDPDKRERLQALSERTGRSVSELAREGVERVLGLAETQMDTIEAAVKRMEEDADG